MARGSSRLLPRRPGAGAAAVGEARRQRGRLACLVSILASLLWATSASADGGVVHAVLFYSPSCPHCHQVMTVDLPPLRSRYGERFQLAQFDVTQPLGQRLYQAAIETLGVPSDRTGVPTLIVGDEVLVGSVEIPELLPGLIEDALAVGGNDWPAIDGLREAIGVPLPATAPPDGPPAADSSADLSLDAIGARLGRDPAGSTIAIGVLIVLLAAVARAAAVLRSARGMRMPGRRPSPWVGGVALAGLLVAAYLASVELSGSTAACGPIGDCNAVHSSTYARVFGIPVGLLGVFGYVALLGCWLAGRTRAAGAAAWIGQVVLAVAGTVFSAYLTFLEPFVIGATCAWCLASALSMAAILVLATGQPSSTGPAVRRRRAA
jgi:uncharacterized membrane protein